jgi:hypothetical protein
MSWREGYTDRVNQLITDAVDETIGENFYLVKTKSVSDHYYSQLQKKAPGANIFSTLEAAEDAMTGDRTDTLKVFPGEHLVTESITWDKNQTIIKGMGGPNQRLASTTIPSGCIRLRCNTEAVTQILNITGHYVQMYGVETINTFNAVTNVSDILIAGKNFYAERCSFRGGNGGSTQLGSNSGIPIWVSCATGGGANMFKLKNCYIGSAGNGVRTDGPGAMYFDGAGRGAFMAELEHCTLSMRCETTGSAAVSLVELEISTNDRYLMFDDCHLYNFWENLGGKMDYAVVDAETATHQILFKRCMFTGIDALCNTATFAFSDNQATGADGSGKATAVDATP